MPVIGITGGIGTGKSTVMRMLRDLGAITISADDAARDALAPGSEGLAEVVTAFGADVLQSSGELDRDKLAAIVFSDPVARKRLESITHPRILSILQTHIADARQSNPPDTVIAVEAPLLFEAGMEDWFDRILVVASSESAQIERLRDRSGMSEEESLSRIRAQIPQREKTARADFVIENDGSLVELKRAVMGFWRKLYSRES